MRLIFTIIILISITSAHAQTFSPLAFSSYAQKPLFAYNRFNDSTNKKWFVSKYTGISTGLVFYKGGYISFLSSPVTLQLNRRLNNNLYAFASVSAAPEYINFNNKFLTSNTGKINQNNSFLKSNNFNISSRVDLGLMYVNDAKTFSISGSIGIERYSEPVLYNRSNATTQNPLNYPRK